MRLFLLTLSSLILISGCSSTPDSSDYASADCDALRDIVRGQDATASAYGIEIYNDGGVAETRAESGSPWAGRPLTRDDDKLEDERQAVREAYRRKGCAN